MVFAGKWVSATEQEHLQNSFLLKNGNLPVKSIGWTITVGQVFMLIFFFYFYMLFKLLNANNIDHKQGTNLHSIDITVPVSDFG